jgi:hypothetical protein
MPLSSSLLLVVSSLRRRQQSALGFFPGFPRSFRTCTYYSRGLPKCQAETHNASESEAIVKEFKRSRGSTISSTASLYSSTAPSSIDKLEALHPSPARVCPIGPPRTAACSSDTAGSRPLLWPVRRFSFPHDQRELWPPSPDRPTVDRIVPLRPPAAQHSVAHRHRSLRRSDKVGTR